MIDLQKFAPLSCHTEQAKIAMWKLWGLDKSVKQSTMLSLSFFFFYRASEGTVLTWPRIVPSVSVKRHLLGNYTSVSHMDIQCLFYCTFQAPKETNQYIWNIFACHLCAVPQSPNIWRNFQGMVERRKNWGVGGITFPFSSAAATIIC